MTILFSVFIFRKGDELRLSDSPHNRLEQPRETTAFFRIEPNDVGDAAYQMSVEVSNSGAVLPVRAMAHTVAHDGLQAVVFRPRCIDLFIDHDSGGALLHALPHDSCLAVLDCKAFLERDRRDVNCEAADRARKRFAARKEEIVGIARVLSFGRLGQSGEPRIESVGGQVRERRRGRRTLMQVRLPVKPPRGEAL